MSNALRRTVSTPTPQSEPRPDHKMAKNSAGGFSYEVDYWVQLSRFLILGTEGGTYYVTERTQTKQAIEALDKCLAEDAPRAMALVGDISERGLAPKNSQALFALAQASLHPDTGVRHEAYLQLNRVCRTATHLFEWLDYCKMLNGGKVPAGNGRWRAIHRWFDARDNDELAYQAIKYRARHGFTQRDLLRLAHVKTDDPGRKAIFDFICGRSSLRSPVTELIAAYKLVNTPGVSNRSAVVVVRGTKLPWEAVPDHHRTPGMWLALLEDMPMTATVRQLATLARADLLEPLSKGEKLVVDRLSDTNQIRRSRIHPIALLNAQLVHRSGGLSGKSRGAPYPANRAVLAALDAAFYTAFENVEPTGKRIYLALDVSGSMAGGYCAGSELLSARVGSVAMAMVTMKTEPRCYARAFSHELVDLPDLHKAASLDRAIQATERIPFGGTDCALPMLDAIERKLEVDCFVIYTDSETWHGRMHPSEALERYRKASGINARLVVVGMVGNRFSIANPKDAGMLDVVGFSSDTPALISAFAAGNI